MPLTPCDYCGTPLDEDGNEPDGVEPGPVTHFATRCREYLAAALRSTRRDLATVTETLTIAQERGTARHNEVVDLKRQIDEYRAYQEKAENLDALQGNVAKALNLTPEQAAVARTALASANAALLYWKDLAELGMAVYKDDQRREAVMLAALRFYSGGHDGGWIKADGGETARQALATIGET